MPAALPLSSDISQASQGATEFKVLINKYGNGYEQRVADGINNAPAKWQVSWENMTLTDFTTIVTAIRSAAGVDYFTWTPPGESAGKYVVGSYSTSAISGSIYTVSAELRQVFDLTA